MATKPRTIALLSLRDILLGSAACGEQATPTPIAVSDLSDITLVPFTSPE